MDTGTRQPRLPAQQRREQRRPQCELHSAQRQGTGGGPGPVSVSGKEGCRGSAVLRDLRFAMVRPMFLGHGECKTTVKLRPSF